MKPTKPKQTPKPKPLARQWIWKARTNAINTQIAQISGGTHR